MVIGWIEGRNACRDASYPAGGAEEREGHTSHGEKARERREEV